jgi:formylglycine-generating enzyme required for sulfatase activity
MVRVRQFSASAIGGLLFLVLLAASPALAETRVALVIGNDNYATLPSLNNAVTDARGIAAKLKSLGFETILETNVGRRKIGRTLARFRGLLAKADVGLVFYAGHGIQLDGENYLVPSDARVEIEEDLPYEAVRASDFLATMADAGTPLNIVIIDACRDNPLPKRTRSGARGLAVVTVPQSIKGTAILYSAGAGQVAQDGPPGGHGVFTGALLDVLDRPGLKLEDVFKQTAAKVSAATGNKQDPWINSSVKGDFYFRPKTLGQNVAPAQGANMEALFWQSAEKSGKAGDYEAYLSAFPDGVFKPLARTRLAALTPASAPPPAIEIEEVDATYLALKTANLRSGPGTSFDKVGRVSKEQALNVTGRVTGKKWLRIAHAGGSAFVFAPLVSEIDPLELAAWQNLDGNPGREELQTFIKRFNAGHYTPKAQAMLEALPLPIPSGPKVASVAPSLVGLPSRSGLPQTIPIPASDVADVAPGDTLYSIARRYGVAMRDVIDANRLKAPFVLEIGQSLRLPPPRLYVVSPGDTIFSISQRFGADMRTLVSMNGLAAPYQVTAGQGLKMPVRGPLALAHGMVFQDCSDCPEMVVVPPGEFMMGSTKVNNEGPVHRVTILAAFSVGKYEVTFDEWDACVSAGWCSKKTYQGKLKDAGWGRGRRPAISVSWDDAQEYLTWLSKKTGKTYRLLSEAEWEYVARAGTKTRFNTGDNISTSQANFDHNPGKTAPVGNYPSNQFGLHDVHGNVWEWVQDCWNDNYNGAAADGSVGTGDCSVRIQRGGSWGNKPRDLRSSKRLADYSFGRPDFGFRVARTLP